MKTKFLTLTFLSLYIFCNAQISLENTYPYGTYPYVTSLIYTGSTAQKYLYYNSSTHLIKLYNLNHSLFKSFPCTQGYSPLSIRKNGAILFASVTDNIFNTDSKYEYILLTANNFQVLNEDGTIIFQKDSIVSYMIEITTSGAKLILTNQLYSQTLIYSLPGTISEELVPSQAEAPTGTNILCENSANTVYSTTGANNAISYIWEILPSNAGSIIGTGLTSTVNWNDTFTGTAQITVKGQNSYGDGATSTLAISVNPNPINAGTISGTSSVCQGQNALTYAVPAITNATTYVWALPSGATGTSTTNSITIDFSITAVSGNITVKGSNSCGDGIGSTLPIGVNIKPVSPVITKNGYTLSSNVSTGNQWYNSLGVISSATSQTYTATIDENYYVVVTENGCSSAQSNAINIMGTSITQTNSNIYGFNIYPNPVKNELSIETNLTSKQKCEILNIFGEVVYTSTVNKTTTFNTSQLSNGVYLVKIYTDKLQLIKKFVKD